MLVQNDAHYGSKALLLVHLHMWELTAREILG
jgi:hypothetical protein